MTVEMRERRLVQHRCMEHGERTKWLLEFTSEWRECPSDHPCPKCSAKPEPEPEHRCSDMPSAIKIAIVNGYWVLHSHRDPVAGRLTYCPYCGEGLRQREA